MFIRLKPNTQLNFKRHVELPVGVMPHQYNLYADPIHREYTTRIPIKDCEQVDQPIYCYYCGSESAFVRRAFLHDGSGYNLWLHSETSANYAFCKNCDRALKSIQYMGRSHELPNDVRSIRQLKPFIFLPTIDSYHSNFHFDLTGHLIPRNKIADNTINLLSLNSKELVHRRIQVIDTIVSDLIDVARDIQNYPSTTKRGLAIQPPIKVDAPLDLNFALSNFDILFIDVIRGLQLDHLDGLQADMYQEILPGNLDGIERENSLFSNAYWETVPSRLNFDDYRGMSYLIKQHYKLHSLLLERLNENIQFNIRDNYKYRNATKTLQINRLARLSEVISFDTKEISTGEHQSINTRIKNISFSNIRLFKDCSSLNFDSAKSIILIGENGVGKSSFLELLKKCLSNNNHNLSNLISLGKDATEVMIEFDNDLSPTTITQNGKRPKVKNKHTSFNVINIGEQRLTKTDLKKKLDYIVENQYQTELVDLIGYHLKVLFNLPASSELRIINNTVIICQGDIEQPIENFSSGYLSLFSIYMSVITNVINHGGYSEYIINIANAIILIDEIELHLHPKFKKEIVKKLNTVFPDTLIFATTHDPLVLSSCTEYDKIVTFRNNGEHTVIDDQLPNVNNYSIEQILTSPIFGLSTVNRHVENIEKIESYHAALRNKDWDLVDQLQDELADSGYFGNSYREFLAHSIVDMYNSEGISATKEELVNELKQSENGE